MINGAEVMAILKWPSALGAAAVGLVIILSAFGVSIATPGDRWAEHDTTHAAINDTLAELDNHMHEQKSLTESLIIGECLESRYDKLGRQGILDTCAELGVERQSGDAIDRELGND